MLLKFIVGALVVAFCTLLGYLAAGKYRLRKSFYTQFSAFNERFLSELGYTRKPVSELLASNSYTGEFGKTIGAFAKDRNTETEYAWLSSGEKEELSDYLSMLGRGDASSQKSYFAAQNVLLSEKKTLCEKEAKSRGELYLKLGLLAGLAFVILIV